MAAPVLEQWLDKALGTSSWASTMTPGSLACQDRKDTNLSHSNVTRGQLDRHRTRPGYQAGAQPERRAWRMPFGPAP